MLPLQQCDELFNNITVFSLCYRNSDALQIFLIDVISLIFALKVRLVWTNHAAVSPNFLSVLLSGFRLKMTQLFVCLFDCFTPSVTRKSLMYGALIIYNCPKENMFLIYISEFEAQCQGSGVWYRKGTFHLFDHSTLFTRQSEEPRWALCVLSLRRRSVFEHRIILTERGEREGEGRVSRVTGRSIPLTRRLSELCV